MARLSGRAPSAGSKPLLDQELDRLGRDVELDLLGA